VLRSQRRVYDGSGEVARTQDVWGAEGISGRVKFLPLAWAGMPKTSFRKNSDSPLHMDVMYAGLAYDQGWSVVEQCRKQKSVTPLACFPIGKKKPKLISKLGFLY